MEIRTKLPKGNKYYQRKRSGGYSDAVAGCPTISGADVLCNCVGYANSRFAEVMGLGYIKYQLVCNAENFIERAKSYGLKVSSKPVQGGIMVWQKGATLHDYDGAGHVAFVEEVYEDGSILTSESGWGSRDWAFKNIHRNNSNGRWGQSSAYKFRGCIVNPYVNGKVAPTPKLDVDGIGGIATVMALQEHFKTVQDGIITGQMKGLSKYYPALKSVQYSGPTSTCIKKMQKWLGVDADGIWGKATSKALQKKLGVEADGIFGTASMKALQRFLNGDKPKPKKPTKTILDVSEFQDSINWKKVKAEGIEGVIVRCGYRGAEKGTLRMDAMFLNHIRGAHKAGLKVGIYMFTEGITAKEGKEEADYALKLMETAGIKLDYPIAVDTEDVWYTKNGKRYPGRANGLSKAKRTEVIKAFCEEIKAKGYTPMIYASTAWLDNKLDMSKLPYKVWVAQYNDTCTYKGDYDYWQYTSTAKVDGVKGYVDKSKVMK